MPIFYQVSFIYRKCVIRVLRICGIGSIIIGFLWYVTLYVNYNQPKTYVVIGASAAGISAVHELIKNSHSNDTIILISKDTNAPYDRTKLKRYITYNTVPLIPLSDECFSRVSVIYSEVKKIDRDQKKVICDDNRTIDYDYLFLGIGLEPRIPSPLESAQEGIFGYYTLQNVCDIKKYLENHIVDSIVIIGGGLASLEISHTLALLGYRIHHCVRGPRILQDKTDESGAHYLQDLFSQHGVQWHFNTTLKDIIYTDTKISHITLDDGTQLPANIVIYAIGGTINNTITDSLDTKDGTLIVDSYMRTSDSSIYAGGDAVYIWDYVNEWYIRNTKWNAAVKQGLCAAHNMCGKEKKYYGTACIYNERYFGVSVALSGPIANPPHHYTYIQESDNGYRSFLMKNDQLKGFCLVDIPRQEIKKYTAILKNDN